MTWRLDRWLALSVAGHMALGLALALLRLGGSTADFLVIAGPEGKGGRGSAIEVGLAEGWEIARLFPQLPAGALGETPGLSTVRIEKKSEADAQPDLVLPGRKPQPPEPGAILTDRPVRQGPRPYTGRQEIGGTTNTSALVGPTLPLAGGVGLGTGPGGGSGIPGGSDYGRRLQQALSTYYRLTPTAALGQRFVIVRVRIARDGRILSIVNGRLDPAAFIRSSGNPIVDTRVEAALLELNRHPIPFPPDFLPGVREAIAEIYFQY
ncbi:MAG: TonB C-terminal domain-containing protein [Blastocatellia bacterium]|nr:TonB C-terminal domain-containing protein [Blastocatellia bacterium]MCS7158032.1 TonB C-terminal domain-containing protein [Blastocatellia bacterium]MDW8257329.1 cell envelope integrity protein TolA [Acidobacteriota bacterium]